jgi:hypothetical protein
MVRGNGEVTRQIADLKERLAALDRGQANFSNARADGLHRFPLVGVQAVPNPVDLKPISRRAPSGNERSLLEEF